MKPVVFFENIDASTPQTSTPFVIDCGQDMRWLLVIEKNATDGNPKLFIEEDVDGVFVPIMNYDCDDILDHFLIDDSPFGVRDSYFMGTSMRIRIEPNDNTTGTITAKMKVKTKSV
jgi:hypothetical protein